MQPDMFLTEIETKKPDQNSEQKKNPILDMDFTGIRDVPVWMAGIVPMQPKINIKMELNWKWFSNISKNMQRTWIEDKKVCILFCSTAKIKFLLF